MDPMGAGKFPDIIKLNKIHIFNKKDKTPPNLRKISTLPIFGKICEKIIQIFIIF